MFGMQPFHKTKHVRVMLPKAALEAVMDECDRYDVDETGGRIVGNFATKGRDLVVTVTGIIEPGPNAQRTATYFKQDGEYQEKVFRRIEDDDRSIEHLGNWHTHHVNGYKQLSSGDIATYLRIVNHEKHHIDFFYALLVVNKQGGKVGIDRYDYKHYILRRGDRKVYEIPQSAVSLVDSPVIWPRSSVPSSQLARESDWSKLGRVHDRDILSQFFPGVTAFTSKKLGGLYWRGPVELIDGKNVDVVVLEDTSEAAPRYSINIMNPSPALEPVSKVLGDEVYGSSRAALITMERMCNRALYLHR